MTTSITFSSAYRILLASEFFMARRPILDRDRHLIAHELLFSHAASAAPPVDLHSASVIADVKQHGLVRILGDGDAYLHVDFQALGDDTLRGIPADRVVLTLMEAHAADTQHVERIAALRQAGFRFALDITQPSAAMQALLPLMEAVRIDIRGKGDRELAMLCRPHLAARKMLLAENVETPIDWERCMAAGFHRFQGYHFAQPRLTPERRVSPSQHAIIELMALLASDADSAEIEHCIKSDATLGVHLLRLVNTPAISAHRIESLRQAVMVLGRNQLQRWLQVMLYANSSASVFGMLPLLTLAASRARLLELVAQKTMPANRGVADTAFTVGILSLMDALFCVPMEDILRELPITEEVRNALLERRGQQGELLRLAEYAEWRGHDGRDMLALMQRLRLSHSELYALQLLAFEWSDQVARSLR
ncbi:HDOD domain-containing protein [Oxalobacteraceae bacterium OM1]|nr:HDOD domain-containing protein [Oxalobacteraceae bacterium OM1]